MSASASDAHHQSWFHECDGWLDADHRLLTSPDGWARLPVDGDVELFRRPGGDERNHFFLWRLPRVGAPPDVVHSAIFDRILDHHGRWTREFAGGRLIAAPSPDRVVFQQWFSPGVPLVSDRDLCYAGVARTLDGGVRLSSYRSVDAAPVREGCQRIRWWGAALCVPGVEAGTTTLTYLDRENQGGRFPAWLMNLLMPRYLRYQWMHMRAFFADGGPPELRAAAAPGGKVGDRRESGR